MKKILPLIAGLNACVEQDLCIQEKVGQFSGVIDSEDIEEFSTSVCNKTAVVLDFDGDSFAPDQGSNNYSYHRDGNGADLALADCVKGQISKFVGVLSDNDSNNLAYKLCKAEAGFLEPISVRMVHFGGREGDCDDHNEIIHPDAEEKCDHIDNDCDGFVDIDSERGDITFWFPDKDGDGYGYYKKDDGYGSLKKDGDGYRLYSELDPLPFYTCEDDAVPTGMSNNYLRDCDDSNPSKYPEAIEDPKDGIDNNCNSVIDEPEQVRLPIDIPPRLDDAEARSISNGRAHIELNIPGQITPAQRVVKNMETFGDHNRLEYVPGIHFAITNLEKDTRTFCNWIIPIIGHNSQVLNPHAKDDTFHMIDHAQAYLELYPDQLLREEAYFRTLNDEKCRYHVGFFDDSDCSHYFLYYRPGSKWKWAEKSIHAAKISLYDDESRSQFEAKLPKHDSYRDLEAMVYRRIRNGAKAEDLLYCADKLERSLKNEIGAY